MLENKGKKLKKIDLSKVFASSTYKDIEDYMNTNKDAIAMFDYGAPEFYSSEQIVNRFQTLADPQYQTHSSLRNNWSANDGRSHFQKIDNANNYINDMVNSFVLKDNLFNLDSVTFPLRGSLFDINNNYFQSGDIGEDKYNFIKNQFKNSFNISLIDGAVSKNIIQTKLGLIEKINQIVTSKIKSVGKIYKKLIKPVVPDMINCNLKSKPSKYFRPKTLVLSNGNANTKFTSADKIVALVDYFTGKSIQLYEDEGAEKFGETPNPTKAKEASQLLANIFVCQALDMGGNGEANRKVDNALKLQFSNEIACLSDFSKNDFDIIAVAAHNATTNVLRHLGLSFDKIIENRQKYLGQSYMDNIDLTDSRNVLFGRTKDNKFQLEKEPVVNMESGAVEEKNKIYYVGESSFFDKYIIRDNEQILEDSVPREINNKNIVSDLSNESNHQNIQKEESNSDIITTKDTPLKDIASFDLIDTNEQNNLETNAKENIQERDESENIKTTISEEPIETDKFDLNEKVEKFNNYESFDNQTFPTADDNGSIQNADYKILYSDVPSNVPEQNIESEKDVGDIVIKESQNADYEIVHGDVPSNVPEQNIESERDVSDIVVTESQTKASEEDLKKLNDLELRDDWGFYNPDTNNDNDNLQDIKKYNIETEVEKDKVNKEEISKGEDKMNEFIEILKNQMANQEVYNATQIGLLSQILTELEELKENNKNLEIIPIENKVKEDVHENLDNEDKAENMSNEIKNSSNKPLKIVNGQLYVASPNLTSDNIKDEDYQKVVVSQKALNSRRKQNIKNFKDNYKDYLDNENKKQTRLDDFIKKELTAEEKIKILNDLLEQFGYNIKITDKEQIRLVDYDDMYKKVEEAENGKLNFVKNAVNNLKDNNLNDIPYSKENAERLSKIAEKNPFDVERILNAKNQEFSYNDVKEMVKENNQKSKELISSLTGNNNSVVTNIYKKLTTTPEFDAKKILENIIAEKKAKEKEEFYQRYKNASNKLRQQKISKSVNFANSEELKNLTHEEVATNLDNQNASVTSSSQNIQQSNESIDTNNDCVESGNVVDLNDELKNEINQKLKLAISSSLALKERLGENCIKKTGTKIEVDTLKAKIITNNPNYTEKSVRAEIDKKVKIVIDEFKNTNLKVKNNQFNKILTKKSKDGVENSQSNFSNKPNGIERGVADWLGDIYCSPAFKIDNYLNVPDAKLAKEISLKFDDVVEDVYNTVLENNRVLPKIVDGKRVSMIMYINKTIQNLNEEEDIKNKDLKSYLKYKLNAIVDLVKNSKTSNDETDSNSNSQSNKKISSKKKLQDLQLSNSVQMENALCEENVESETSKKEDEKPTEIITESKEIECKTEEKKEKNILYENEVDVSSEKAKRLDNAVVKTENEKSKKKTLKKVSSKKKLDKSLIKVKTKESSNKSKSNSNSKKDDTLTK